MKNVADDFAQAMVFLAAAYDAKLSEARIRIYAQALCDVETAVIKAAMLRAVKECSYFPTVAELRRFIVPSTDDAGLIAWTGLQKAASAVGSWQSLNFEDYAAAEALLTVFGSWPAFCAMEQGPALTLKRQEFLAAYREACRHPHYAAVPTRVLGSLEHQGGDGRTYAGLLTASGNVFSLPDKALPGHVGETKVLTDGRSETKA